MKKALPLSRVLLLSGCLAATSLVASTAAAYDATLDVFGARWGSEDLASTNGAGVGYSHPISRRFSLDVRATDFGDLEARTVLDAAFDLTPLDAGGRFWIVDSAPAMPYVGAGLTWAMLDGRSVGTRFDPRAVETDDELGYYVAGGSRFGGREGLGLFVEGLYRDLETDVVIRTLPLDPEILQLVGVDERRLNLGGLSLHAGASWRF